MPILSPSRTVVSNPFLVFSRMSLSILTLLFSNNIRIEDPPNAKYPFSSPFLTTELGLNVW